MDENADGMVFHNSGLEHWEAIYQIASLLCSQELLAVLGCVCVYVCAHYMKISLKEQSSALMFLTHFNLL